MTYGQGSTASGLASAIKVVLNATGSPVAATLSNSTTVALTSIAIGQASNYTLSVQVVSNDPTDFSTPSFGATPSGATLTGGQDATGSTVYSYTAAISGNGNISSVTDSVMGSWSYLYNDGANRLTSATSGNKSITWTYDPWGNRQTESPANISGITASGPINYTVQNRVSTFTYNDGAGGVTQDNLNQYLYDQEGRICAVYNYVTSAIGDQYNALGTRVARGSLSTFACTASLTRVSAKFILGLGSEQVTELNGTGAWQHTNVWAGGKLLGTYDNSGLHFYFDDWLGSRRVQTSATATIQQSCTSYPYGDGESCTPSPTEHLFTGKERDTESGNDYFGARYYASSMGRWLSPDWSAKVEPVPYAKLDFPQSLNLYAYVGNNPVTGVDADGHDSPQEREQLVQSSMSYLDKTVAKYAAEVDALFMANAIAYLEQQEDQQTNGVSPQSSGTFDPASIPGPKGAPRFTSDQIITAALAQPNLNSCTTQFFGRGYTLTPQNAPGISVISPSQMADRVVGHDPDTAGTYDTKSNKVLYNSKIFNAQKLDFVYFQSNYIHETGNLLSIRRYGNPLAKGATNLRDRDTGANFERCVFGRRMQIF